MTLFKNLAVQYYIIRQSTMIKDFGHLHKMWTSSFVLLLWNCVVDFFVSHFLYCNSLVTSEINAFILFIQTSTRVLQFYYFYTYFKFKMEEQGNLIWNMWFEGFWQSFKRIGRYFRRETLIVFEYENCYYCIF